MNTKINEMNTAALPKSLAFFDKSWCSREILSTTASILEFISSMISKTIILPIISIFSTNVAGKNSASGINMILRNNSCLKALSSLKAKLNPEKLLISAKKTFLD